VLHGDPRPCVGQVRDVVGDEIVEGDSAILDELHDDDGRHRFGDRADGEDGFARDGGVQFDVGEAVGVGFDDGAVLQNREGEAWDFAGGHFVENELVVSRSGVVRRDLGAG
jgi:hypothetical protein